MISEWEKDSGQKWPKYTEDVLSEKTGLPIQKNIKVAYMVLVYQQMNYLSKGDNDKTFDFVKRKDAKYYEIKE